MNTTATRLPRLYTLAETADLLRVSTKTVRRLISRGQLNAQRVGNRIRIFECDIRAYLCTGPTTAHNGQVLSMYVRQQTANSDK